jgi:hypothetical protein
MHPHTVAERVDRDQHVADVCLHLSSAAVPLCLCVCMRRRAGASWSTHVYLAILESLLQVLVDGFVGDLADQREIRDSDLLLLGRLEDSFRCELGLRLRGSGTSGILLAPGALRYRLYDHVLARVLCG